jgi:cell division protease FtsH
VRKVSINPRGMALGVTLSAPDDDQVSYALEDLIAKLKVTVAGRVAEEIVYGTITTGAESDIQQLTMIARQIVGRWGMRDAIGLVSVLPAEGLGPLLGAASETSQATQQLVDGEVRRLIDGAHRATIDLPTDHREQLEHLTEALLDAETLDGIDAYRAAGMPMRSKAAGAVAPGSCGSIRRAPQRCVVPPPLTLSRPARRLAGRPPRPALRGPGPRHTR